MKKIIPKVSAPAKSAAKLLMTWRRCDNPHTIIVTIPGVRFPANENDTDAAAFIAAGPRTKRHPLFSALARIEGLVSASVNTAKSELQIDASTDALAWNALMPMIIDAVRHHVVQGHRVMAQEVVNGSKSPPNGSPVSKGLR